MSVSFWGEAAHNFYPSQPPLLRGGAAGGGVISMRLHIKMVFSGRITIRTLTANCKEQGRVLEVSVLDKNLWDANLMEIIQIYTP